MFVTNEAMANPLCLPIICSLYDEQYCIVETLDILLAAFLAD
ncbi:hypothetical protein SAMN05518672_101339 [Chitinophaga sp. CF118]|nr:hypothetical protein SAMN05518672_101339 [Chitinophaga sp. CF118]